MTPRLTQEADTWCCVHTLASQAHALIPHTLHSAGETAVYKWTAENIS